MEAHDRLEQTIRLLGQRKSAQERLELFLAYGDEARAKAYRGQLASLNILLVASGVRLAD